MEKNIQSIVWGVATKPLLFLVFVASYCLSGCNSDSQVDPPNPNPNPSDFYDWDRQIAQTSDNLKDIDFVDNNFGWAVGEKLVLATSIAGSLWSAAPQGLNIPPEQIQGIFFIDQQQGWLVGNNEDDEGQIFNSQQGGAYFVLQETTPNPLNGVFFLNDQLGWVIGITGEVLHTIDGGAEWNTLAALGVGTHDLHFNTDRKGWIVGDNGSLFHTTDGTNFTSQNLGNGQERLNAVHFVDTLNGWVCGNRNSIFKRHLNAQNQIVWTDVSIPQASESVEWMDICFLDRLQGWVVGIEGNIYRTTDGGATWDRETVNSFDDLNAISMVSSTKGWIAGNNGLILTYTP